MNARGMIYGALVVAVVAILLSLWAIWEARTAAGLIDGTVARLDPIEAARTQDAATVEALQGEVEELSARVTELEQAFAEVPGAEPEVEEEPDVDGEPPAQ